MKNNMRKIVTAVLAAGMSAALFTGCGSSGNAAKQDIRSLFGKHRGIFTGKRRFL